ncbi:MAG: NADP-dependent isocitrate dehydrogenase [SAR202 cluster bacterium]|nr:isocitrate dehydrogenase (NADP(+)) [Chloroflexota bacterium]MQG33784.1 NADP-dependent isocitrate dehydrogenase [SAR202 cluster bacterium]HCL26487.1 NADP-dependent isocitrate dehydrogenase [Dehalococcoidia bacterium]HCP23260.1 NADP-dependent isocitrate dehydrogenase [Dehalococcoidia bacterium]|tara:strand:- start:13217 stop:15445 length:2229 start_codon:yes stop_codon:yes gene_type:complete
MPEASKIIYTKIDEAPALATHSLLPILRAFTKGSGIDLESWDISLTGRILANFPDKLTEEQKIPDYLTMCSELCESPAANIIKLPNISASIPQLKGAIAELQEKGYDIPDYPDEPANDAQQAIFDRYSKVLGSAVNPVLREGNSDRRSATAVKEHGKRYPHKMMREWPEVSKARVAHMTGGDFYGSEQAVTVESEGTAKIEYVSRDGRETLLKDGIPMTAGEIVDCGVMNVRELREFYADEMQKAKDEGVLISLHVKSTMMRVSDPIIFGHCVSVYYQDVFTKHAAEMDELAVNPDNGIAELYTKIQSLTDEKREEIEADIQATYSARPELMMVNSNRGITNLHVPSDVIIDATMPVLIRDGGKTWGPDNELHDTVAMIPDRSYATLYQAVVEDCQKNGAFDPASIGSVANVGLMAQKAEEYGSHDKTFRAPGNGTIRVVDDKGTTLMEQLVEQGDIFRMCQTKDEPIQDWVKLGVTRSRITGAPAIFWLDPNRAHDAELIKKVDKYLPNHDTSGLEIQTMATVDAIKHAMARSRAGQDTISVTGNVLRDYLTDLFPILELGTSAKMLSVVPLLKGGGMFETGAGGSAPRHVQQFLEEGHLRWDSLGEFCALVASFEHLAQVFSNDKAQLLADTLDEAIGEHLEQSRAPSRRVNELDTRGSHFYLALYWAQALAKQTKDTELQARFKPVAEQMAANEAKIVQELNDAQGQTVDIGGYYHPNDELASKAMRPSVTLNAIVDAL